MDFSFSARARDGSNPSGPSNPETPHARSAKPFAAVMLDPHSLSLEQRATSSITPSSDTPSLIRALSNASPTPFAVSAAAKALNLAVNVQPSSIRPTTVTSELNRALRNGGTGGSRSKLKWPAACETTPDGTLPNNINTCMHSITSLPPVASSRQMLLACESVQVRSLSPDRIEAEEVMDKQNSSTSPSAQMYEGNSTRKQISRKLFTGVQDPEGPLPCITSVLERHQVSRLSEEQSEPLSVGNPIDFSELVRESSESESPRKYTALETNIVDHTEDSVVTGRDITVNIQNDNIGTTVPVLKASEDGEDTDDDAICTAAELDAKIFQTGEVQCNLDKERFSISDRESRDINKSDTAPQQDLGFNYTGTKNNAPQVDLSNNKFATSEKGSNKKLNQNLKRNSDPSHATNDNHCDPFVKSRGEMINRKDTINNREDEGMDKQPDLRFGANVELPSNAGFEDDENDRSKSLNTGLFMEDDNLVLDAELANENPTNANKDKKATRISSDGYGRTVAKGGTVQDANELKSTDDVDQEKYLVITPKLALRSSAQKNTRISCLKSGSERLKRRSARRSSCVEEPEKIAAPSEDNLMNSVTAASALDVDKNHNDEITFLNEEAEHNINPVVSVGQSATKRWARWKQHKPEAHEGENTLAVEDAMQYGIPSDKNMDKNSEARQSLEKSKERRSSETRMHRGIFFEDGLSADEVKDNNIDGEYLLETRKSRNSSRKASHSRSEGRKNSSESHVDEGSLSEGGTLFVPQVMMTKEKDEIECQETSGDNKISEDEKEESPCRRVVRRTNNGNVKTSLKKPKLKSSAKNLKTPVSSKKVDRNQDTDISTFPTHSERRDVEGTANGKPRSSGKGRRMSEVLRLQKSLASAAWTDSRAVEKQTEVIGSQDDDMIGAISNVPEVVTPLLTVDRSPNAETSSMLPIGTRTRGRSSFEKDDDIIETAEDEDDDNAILIMPPLSTKKKDLSVVKDASAIEDKAALRHNRSERKKTQTITGTFQNGFINARLDSDENGNDSENDENESNDDNLNNPVDLDVDRRVRRSLFLRANATRAVRRGGAVRRFVGNTRKMRSKMPKSTENIVTDGQGSLNINENHNDRDSPKNDNVKVDNLENGIDPVLGKGRRFSKPNGSKGQTHEERDITLLDEKVRLEEMVGDIGMGENVMDDGNDKLQESLKGNATEHSTLERKRKLSGGSGKRTRKKAKVRLTGANNKIYVCVD